MIDTDKWMASARVSLDELEKEVKQLREQLRLAKEWVADVLSISTMDIFREYIGDGEE